MREGCGQSTTGFVLAMRGLMRIDYHINSFMLKLIGNWLFQILYP